MKICVFAGSKRVSVIAKTGRTRSPDSSGSLTKSTRRDVNSPDFVTRLKTGAPMNDARRNTLFGGDAPRGYVDYPALNGMAVA